MESSSPTDQQAPPQSTGLSHLGDAEAAGREAVRGALAGHAATAEDLIILFTSVDRDVEAVYRAAVAEAAPAGVFGCSSTGGFTDTEQVPSGCVAALLAADGRCFGVCQVERDEDDIADSARRAAQGARDRAGDRHPHSVLLLLTDGMIRDQREIARGAYEVTTAVTPFVGGVAGDALTWDCTYTFGDGRVLTNGIVAVWINSEQAMGVSVDHGWRPVGRPMLVTRAEARSSTSSMVRLRSRPSWPNRGRRLIRKMTDSSSRCWEARSGCPMPAGTTTCASCMPTCPRAAGSTSTPVSRTRASCR
jgi:hypothetical protein